MEYIIFLLCYLTFSCTVNEILVVEQGISLKVLRSQPESENCNYDLFGAINILKTRLNFINQKDDIVFIIQEYDVQSGEFYVSIWNNKSKFEYRRRGEVKWIENSLFPEYYYSLVQNWDIDTIKQYEEKYGNHFGSNKVNAYKIHLDESGQRSDCISFSSFYIPRIKN